MQPTHVHDLAILGAGPVGLEASLRARGANLDFVVLEQEKPAASLERWGFVQMFSPWSMNVSALGRELLAIAPHDACPTGREMKAHYYDVIANRDSIRSHLRLGFTVKRVSREGLLKGELPGDSRRAFQPFVIYGIDRNGQERYLRARAVIDATGVYSSWNCLGQGGLPALGEIAHEKHISYHLRDVSRRGDLGPRFLVVGAGHSACNMVVHLAELAEKRPDLSVTWVTKRDQIPPVRDIANDPLPERQAIVKRANALAKAENSPVRHLSGYWVGAIEDGGGEGRLSVKLFGGTGRTTEVDCDHIFAMVGYRPDRTLYEDLQVHECYASAGPMKLAAQLLASDVASDCTQEIEASEDLYDNPEPNFYILGSKSYGRTTNFLLATGLKQLETVFSRLEPSLAELNRKQAS